MYMDNRYIASQLFALMETNYNLRGVGMCKENRKVFTFNLLSIDNNCERGSYKRLVDKRLV